MPVTTLVEQSEENTGIAVEETIGDAAYGDGGADAGRTLIAKVPGLSTWRPAPAPARPGRSHTLRTNPDQPVGLTYLFDPGVPVRGGWKGKGRTVTLHPQEALLQQARADFLEMPFRQSRYFAGPRPSFSLAATVANLLVATKTGMMSQVQAPPPINQRIDRTGPPPEPALSSPPGRPSLPIGRCQLGRP